MSSEFVPYSPSLTDKDGWSGKHGPEEMADYEGDVWFRKTRKFKIYSRNHIVSKGKTRTDRYLLRDGRFR